MERIRKEIFTAATHYCITPFKVLGVVWKYVSLSSRQLNTAPPEYKTDALLVCQCVWLHWVHHSVRHLAAAQNCKIWWLVFQQFRISYHSSHLWKRLTRIYRVYYYSRTVTIYIFQYPPSTYYKYEYWGNIIF